MQQLLREQYDTASLSEGMRKNERGQDILDMLAHFGDEEGTEGLDFESDFASSRGPKSHRDR